MSIQILFTAILLYLAWALIFHKRDKSLTSVILIEYLLIALLVVVLLLGVSV